MPKMTKIGKHRTKVFKGPYTTVVEYCNTPVVSFTKDTITLNTGGYFTTTTKVRMNQASNEFGLGYQVYQKEHEWYVNYRGCTYCFCGENKIIMSRGNMDLGEIKVGDKFLTEEGNIRTVKRITTGTIYMHEAGLVYNTDGVCPGVIGNNLVSRVDYTPPTIQLRDGEKWENGEGKVGKVKMLPDRYWFTSDDEEYVVFNETGSSWTGYYAVKSDGTAPSMDAKYNLVKCVSPVFERGDKVYLYNEVLDTYWKYSGLPTSDISEADELYIEDVGVKEDKGEWVKPRLNHDNTFGEYLKHGGEFLYGMSDWKLVHANRSVITVTIPAAPKEQTLDFDLDKIRKIMSMK